VNLSITARHIDITDSIKEYLQKRLNKLKKYFNEKEVNIHIVFLAEKERRCIEITLHYNGNILYGRETKGDLYTSIDEVMEKLERQLEKCKEKNQKKPRISTKEIPEETTPAVKTIQRKKLALKPITLEEAIIQLEQTSLDFFVFTDAQTNTINVLYRSKNGNYGLLETYS